MTETENGGASFRGEKTADLLETQRTQLTEIISRILDITSDPVPEKTPVEDDIQRPHHVFCLDGARGAGKTYTLLTLEHLLKYISRAPPAGAADGAGLWNTVVDADRAAAARRLQRRETLVQPLRVIVPGDLEKPELVMEAIFAAIRCDIDEAKRKIDREGEYNKDDRLKKYKELSTTLSKEIAGGWHFAHRLGFEALVRDSLDFDGLIRKYDEQSTTAANRISAWRKFLDAYLEFKGAAFLAIMLDDSDVRPEATFDILRSIRTFLNHPRLLTVLAANIRSMRESLLHVAMQAISPSMGALNKRSHPTGAQWRHAIRVGIEEYLEKVLPESKRFYLERPNFEHDFKRIAKATINQICDYAVTTRREQFVRAKFLLALRREAGGTDLPEASERKQLEEYISWWIFRAKYLPMLAPRTARQIESFRDYFAPPEESAMRKSSGDLRTKKRLLVSIFNNPANHSLIQRFSDEDNNAVSWLIQQNFESNWIGTRYFRLNERTLSEGTYSYDYIRYRLDVGLGLPLAENSETILPPKLLPIVRGRQRMRRFYKPSSMHRREKTLGVARSLDHAAIPGNCLGLYDLSGLPDLAFVDSANPGADKAGGDWEASLWATWPEFLEEDQQEKDLERYFIDVVCQRLRHTQGVHASELISVLNSTDTQIERKHVAYTTFLWDEIRSFVPGTARPRTWHRKGKKLAAQHGHTPIITEVKPPYRGEELDKHIPISLARYAALMTDLRRAWHAIRIHESAIRARKLSVAPDRFGPAGRSLLGMIDNRGRLKLYSRATLLSLLNQDDWVRGMLDAFSRERLGAKYLEPLWQDDRTLGQNEMNVEREVLNFKREWAQSWREFGRTACAQWPSFDDKDISQEGGFFAAKDGSPDRSHLRLTIWDDDDALFDIMRASPAVKTIEEARERLASNAESARQFAWLMYGLAPSLPAVIHSEIASRLYDAVQLAFAAKNSTEDATQSSDFGSRAMKSLRKTKTLLREWRELIMQMSAVLKYTKMKSLHLQSALTFAAVNDIIGYDGSPPMTRHSNAHAESRVDVGQVSQLLRTSMYSSLNQIFKDLDPAKQRDLATKNEKTIDEFLLKCKMPARPAGEEGEHTRIWQFLGAKFCGTEGGRLRPIRSDLSIMPDASPSTLFGEKWLLDLARRLSKGHQDSGVVTTEGVFGETEHWLWAAHRMLRRAEAVVYDLDGTPVGPGEDAGAWEGSDFSRFIDDVAAANAAKVQKRAAKRKTKAADEAAKKSKG